MKKNRFIQLLFFLFLVGCNVEPIDFLESSDFTISSAKSYFEENATDLQNVHFGPEGKSRSSENDNISPNWKSARITQTGKITTVEVPLEGDVSKVARTSKMGNNKKLYGFTTKLTTKLVIQKHSQSGATRQFIVTMIDGIAQNTQDDNTRDYYGMDNYSGYIIISTVTGEYLESFHCINRIWKRVYMVPGTKEDVQNTQYESIHLLGADASPATYNIGEGGSTRCSNCGNVLSMCTCCKFCGGKGCSKCTVIVYPTCPKCHYTGPGAASGNCNCCRTCHNYPCTCFTSPDPDPDPEWICPRCGSQYCNGNCPTGGTGTGTGTGESQKDTPLLDKIYHPNSSLNDAQKKKLEQAIKEFTEKYPEFKEMYDNLVDKNKKLICKMDTKLLEALGANAGYDAKTESLLFRGDEFIREVYLQEELIHASQHLEFYGTEMNISRKNVEFEAKIVQDMLMWKHIGYGAEIGSVGHDNEFMSDYSRLLENYTIQGFHELCIRWKGYSGSYNPNFVPKVIQSYLKK